MNSFNALPSVNPEVRRSPEQKSGWDDVAVLPKEESWENHVKKSNCAERIDKYRQ